MYRDILPFRYAETLSQRQIDAFQLYLFSYDLQFIYQKYASTVKCIGDVKVVRFKG